MGVYYKPIDTPQYLYFDNVNHIIQIKAAISYNLALDA